MKAEVFTEGEKQTNKQHGLMCSIIETRDFCLKLSKPILDLQEGLKFSVGIN